MPGIPPPDAVLSNGEVSLRLTAERDIPEILIAYEDDRHLHERLGEERPPTGAQLGRATEEAAGAMAAGLYVQLAVTAGGSDTCVGLVTIGLIQWAEGRAEIQLWVAPGQRGRGHARAALALAAGWAFDAWGLECLTALVQPDNAAMLHAAAAVGFVEEGVVPASERGELKVLVLAAEDLVRA